MGKYNMDNVNSYYVQDTETTAQDTLEFIEFLEQMNVRRTYIFMLLFWDSIMN